MAIFYKPTTTVVSADAGNMLTVGSDGGACWKLPEPTNTLKLTKR